MCNTLVCVRLAVTALLRGRWRKLRRDGGRRALGQFGAGVLFVLTVVELKGGMTTTAFARLWSEFGLGLWSAWVAAAAVTRGDFGWRVHLRPWISLVGFWNAYFVSALLGPMSPVMLGGFLAALLAMVIGLHVAIARLPLAAVLLWLIILGTLRITSSIRVLTRGGGSHLFRACGFALAFGLAGWNELAHGPPPMHCLGDAMHAPPAQSLSGILGLPLLLVMLFGVDGWLTRWDVLRGRSERRHSTLGVVLLGSGAGYVQALRRAAVLSWKAWVWATVACGALWFPLVELSGRLGTAPGMGLLFCAYTLMFPCWARGNLLGADGPGIWRYLCAGVGPADVLLQRGFAFNVLQVLMLLPSVVLVAALRPAGWVGILAMVAFAAATLAVMDGAGMLISRDFPEPDRPSDESGGLTTGGAVLWLGTVVWDVALVASFVFAWPNPAERFWPTAVAIACLFFRWLVVRSLRRDSTNVWTSRTLSGLGAIWA